MLIIEGLNKSYGVKKVLDNVTFSLPSGKVCAILGLNGAGKSTLMKIIATLAFPDSGSVKLDGRGLFEDPERKIGCMIENPHFYRELTGKENLTALSFLYNGISKERINDVLILTGLEKQKDTAVKTYSLGMKQRLYFAYAVLNQPKLLILDEPFNGIDPVTVRLFQKLIADFAEKDCTVLLSGHTIKEISSVSDSALILDNGKIIYKEENSQRRDLTETFLSLVGHDGGAQ